MTAVVETGRGRRAFRSVSVKPTTEAVFDDNDSERTFNDDSDADHGMSGSSSNIDDAEVIAVQNVKDKTKGKGLKKGFLRTQGGLSSKVYRMKGRLRKRRVGTYGKGRVCLDQG